MKVLFLTNVPSPYRVDFFNELGKMCELTVLFEKSTSDERDDSWKKYHFESFKGVFLKGKRIGVDNALCFEVVKYLNKTYDHIIISDFLDPTGMIAIEYMRVKRIPYWLESDGGIAKEGKGFSEKVKKHFIKGAYGYFSTSKVHDDYYKQYGADIHNIHRYPFSSIKNKDLLDECPTAFEKVEYKKNLGMGRQFVVLSVGRFSYLNGYGKGYDVLMRAAEQLRGIHFYIVGDEPTDEFQEWKTRKQLDNVHFVGFLNKDGLKKYYIAADVFVLMTVSDVWGLVINEAMSYGLPIVTTDKCVSGTELVCDGENGYVIPVGSDSRLIDCLFTLTTDNNLLCDCGRCSFNRIREYTIENMATEHIRILGEK